MCCMENRALVDSYLSSSVIERDNLTKDSHVIVGQTENENEWLQIPLHGILQNLLMYMFICDQLSDKVYHEVVGITLDTSSTRFMSTAVQITERDRENLSITESQKNTSCRNENSEVFIKDGRKLQFSEATRNRNCFHCSKPGNFAKECRKSWNVDAVKFIQGHETMECRKRQNDIASKAHYTLI